MGYSLQPAPQNAFLSMGEAIARIIDAFLVHDIDQERGGEAGARTVAQLERMSAPQDIVESYRERQKRVCSIYLSDCEDDNRYLSFLLWPDERILISFSSQQHQDESDTLVHKLAEVLGYEVSVV